MAGLFDFIKAAMVLGGGSRMARQEEEDLRSQIEHRKETIDVQREGIAANKEMATAQRELAERLQGKEQEHQKGMKTQEIDWEREKLIAEKVFLRSENAFARRNAKELAQLQIDAQKAMQEKSIMSAEKIADQDAFLKWQIAQLDAKLRLKGLALDKEKLAKTMDLEKLQILVKAIDISTKATTGTEGLMTAATGKGEMGDLLSATRQNLLSQSLKLIDPDGKLGLRDIKLSDYVSKDLGGGDKGSQDAQDILRKMGVNVPGVSAPPATPASPAPLLSPQSLDTVAPSPAPAPTRTAMEMNFDGLNAADVLGLDRVAFEIQQLPEAARPEAFREYQTIIQDPTFMPAGNATNDPMYRGRMVKYLQKSTGFDFSK